MHATLGNDITEGRILGIAGEITPERIERITSRFRRTPVTAPDDVPRGQYQHIGDGIWLHRCRSCDDYVRSYAPIMYLYDFARHEATHTELLGTIPGYDLALLA